MRSGKDDGDLRTVLKPAVDRRRGYGKPFLHSPRLFFVILVLRSLRCVRRQGLYLARHLPNHFKLSYMPPALLCSQEITALAQDLTADMARGLNVRKS